MAGLRDKDIRYQSLRALAIGYKVKAVEWIGKKIPEQGKELNVDEVEGREGKEGRRYVRKKYIGAVAVFWLHFGNF